MSRHELVAIVLVAGSLAGCGCGERPPEASNGAVLAESFEADHGARLCLEAEAGAVAEPCRVTADTTAAGGSCVEIPDGVNPRTEGSSPTGGVTLTFEVETPGTYTLWARVLWKDECGNSFWVVADGISPYSLTDALEGSWHWVRGPRIELPAGAGTIEFRNREDGVRLDQVFLAQDEEYVPAGKETDG